MSIASELQDKIDAKAAIKAAIEAKGVTVGDVKLNEYAEKIDAIAQDPSIPVGTGQHLVTFYDFDGKVLKRQRVATGGNATAPITPTHQYLTFAEWNNPFTNVQSDIDTGAIYNTTDGKTYLFITLTPVTGLAPTLYFSKSSTSLMTIDWGDGTTSTSTTSGNQSINHVYATAGDYIITVDNSAGGTWSIGQGAATTALFYGYTTILIKIYYGLNVVNSASGLHSHYSLKYVSQSNVAANSSLYNTCKALLHININNNSLNFNQIFRDCFSIKNIIFKNTTTTISATNLYGCYSLEKQVTPFNLIGTDNNFMYNCTSLKYVYFGSALTYIGTSAFALNTSTIFYVFLSTTPPTLANINAFTGINPICKIYVPDASVAAYKAATNWSFYANYIYPLSQKPQSDE